MQALDGQAGSASWACEQMFGCLAFSAYQIANEDFGGRD
jgi:hypothetical protein